MRIATVGTGHIISAFLNAAALVEGMEVTAMYTRTRENAIPLAQQYGIEALYTNYAQMLAQEDIDMIYVASVNSAHYEHAKQALLAGKHVMCEKPFTSTVAEFLELRRLARERRLFLFEAIMPIHTPNFQAMKKALPELGSIKMVHSNFSQYSRRYDAFKAGGLPNVFNPALSGGALGDINIYNLHIVVGLFGKPHTVHYFANKAPNGIDTSGTVILCYDGFHAVCVSCKDSAGKKSLQVQGDEGYLFLDEEISRCMYPTLHKNGEVTDLNCQEGTNGFTFELTNFHSIVDKKDYSACETLLDHCQAVMEVYQAAREYAKIVFAADNQK